MLWLLKKENRVCFWEEGYHGEEIFTPDFFKTKLTYIHLNPVRAGIVEKEEEYLYSFAAIITALEKDCWNWLSRGLKIPFINKFDMPFRTCRTAGIIEE